MLPRFYLALLLAVGADALRVGGLCTRGDVLAAAVAAATSCALPAVADMVSETPALPEYDEAGQLVKKNGYSEETGFRTVKKGAASVRVLAPWADRSDGGFDDPVLGRAAQLFEMSAMPTEKATIADYGKPEVVPLVKTLDLEPELKRADLVAAAIRKADDAVMYYDFDLALPAKNCVPELATACLPERVILLSCGVRNGQLHVVRVDAMADQWRRSGQALRLLRSSFLVAESP